MCGHFAQSKLVMNNLAYLSEQAERDFVFFPK
ncbi:hypothetical protein EDC47_109236 [Raoultella planticola]|nr:hypothetical protein EDC47_109236 [Raoultella planticola]